MLTPRFISGLSSQELCTLQHLQQADMDMHAAAWLKLAWS